MPGIEGVGCDRATSTGASPSAAVKIAELEGLRGLLAWWVVAGHLLGSSGYGPSDLSGILRVIRTGSLAVDVFIILSGFVVFLVLDQQRTNYRSFIVRRVFRLYPVYVLCLALGLIGLEAARDTYRILPDIANAQQFASRYADTHNYFWQHLVAHLSMLHGAIPNEVLPYSSGAFLDPAWSISLEWQFYLLAPVLFFAMTRSGLGLLLAGAAIVLLKRVGPAAGSFDFASFLPLKLHFFWVGALCYLLLRWLRRSQVVVPHADAILGVACAIPILFLDGSAARIPMLVWLASLALVSVPPDSSRGWTVSSLGSSAMKSRFLQFLGRTSYVTYLVHIPIIQVLRWLMAKAFPDLSSLQLFIALLALSVPAVLGASVAISRYVEQPGIRLGRRLATGVTGLRTARQPETSAAVV
jgi:peptidoglycan/LPS O-acetylase OafA/YrhL